MRIKGEKVALRPMKPDEVELIHEWANTPDVMPFWYGKKKSLEQIKEDWKPDYFSDEDPFSGRCFAIELNKKPIGMIIYNRIDRENRSTDIDILIGKKEHWGKGFGVDALRTFIGFLFKTYNLNRIWLATYVYNRRAIRAYEKVGFKKEGILREDALINGKFVDSILFSILRREFKRS